MSFWQDLRQYQKASTIEKKNQPSNGGCNRHDCMQKFKAANSGGIIFHPHRSKGRNRDLNQHLKQNGMGIESLEVCNVELTHSVYDHCVFDIDVRYR